MLGAALAVGAMTWIASKLINTAGATITDEALRGVGTFGSESCLLVFHLMDQFVLKAFHPGLALWNQAFGSTDAFDVLLKRMQVISAALILILTILAIIFYFIKANHDQNASPFKIIFRVMIASFLVLQAKNLTTALNNTWYKIYQAITVIVVDDSGAESSIFSEAGQALYSEDTDTLSLAGLPLTTEVDGAGVSVFFAFGGIFTLLIFWPLMKEYIRYFLEMFERYLVIIIMLLFLPLASAMIVLEETSNIFVSFMRMVIGQFTLLLISQSFLHLIGVLITRTVKAGNFSTFVFMYLFTIAFARMAQRIDSYMNAMGFNVARTGIDLGGAIRGAGMSLLAAGRTLNSAQRGLRSTAGKGMTALGAATGNRNLFAAGNVINPNRQYGISKGALDRGFAAEAGRHGRQAAFDAKTSANAIQGAIMAPGANAHFANNIDQKSLCAGVGELVNGGYNNNKIGDISNAVVDPVRGQFSFSGTDEMGNSHAYTLSKTNDDGTGQALFNADGSATGLYLNSNSDLSQNGEMISAIGNDGNVSVEANASLMTSAGMMGISEPDAAMANIDNGDTTFYNKEGNAIGRMDGDTSSYYNADNNIQSSSRLDKIKNDISSAYHPDEFVSSKLENDGGGHYYMDIKKNGEQKRVRISDYGTNGRMKTNDYENNTVRFSNMTHRDSKTGKSKNYRYYYGIESSKKQANEGAKPKRPQPKKKGSSKGGR